MQKKTMERLLLFKNETILKEIAIGKILGDGHISKEGVLYIMHSEKQKDYVYHLHELFKNYVNKDPIRNINYSKGKKNISYSFGTQALFKEYEKLFYVDCHILTGKRKKIIPPNIGEIFTARSLAYLIMDDGYFKSGVQICTHCFTLEEVILFKSLLEDKFNLSCTIRKDHTIYIKSGSLNTLRGLVEEYMLPSMRYKLGLK